MLEDEDNENWIDLGPDSQKVLIDQVRIEQTTTAIQHVDEMVSAKKSFFAMTFFPSPRLLFPVVLLIIGEFLALQYFNNGSFYELQSHNAWQVTASIEAQSKSGGLSNAQYLMGVCFEQGLSVTASPEEAMIWYDKAAVSGHTRATTARNRLNGNLSSSLHSISSQSTALPHSCESVGPGQPQESIVFNGRLASDSKQRSLTVPKDGLFDVTNQSTHNFSVKFRGPLDMGLTVSNECLVITTKGLTVTNEGVVVTTKGLTVSNEGLVVATKGLTATNDGLVIVTKGLTVPNEGKFVTTIHHSDNPMLAGSTQLISGGSVSVSSQATATALHVGEIEVAATMKMSNRNFSSSYVECFSSMVSNDCIEALEKIAKFDILRYGQQPVTISHFARLGSTNLGNFYSFAEHESGAFTAQYANGSNCRGVASYSSTVHFTCGFDGRIINVIAPVRSCHYSMRVQSPLVCSPAKQQRYEITRQALIHTGLQDVFFSAPNLGYTLKLLTTLAFETSSSFFDSFQIDDDGSITIQYSNHGAFGKFGGISAAVHVTCGMDNIIASAKESPILQHHHLLRVQSPLVCSPADQHRHELTRQALMHSGVEDFHVVGHVNLPGIYAVRLFKQAQQVQISGKSINIGLFDSFQENEDGSLTLEYSNGDECEGVGARSAQVHVTCGKEDKILSVQEAPLCRYSLVVESPQGCPFQAMPLPDILGLL